MPGRYSGYRPLLRGGPHGPSAPIFKCVHCNSETVPPAGFNGEPNIHNCPPGCPCHTDAKGHEPSSAAYVRAIERMAQVDCPVGGCTLVGTGYCFSRCPDRRTDKKGVFDGPDPDRIAD